MANPDDLYELGLHTLQPKRDPPWPPKRYFHLTLLEGTGQPFSRLGYIRPAFNHKAAIKSPYFTSGC